MRTDKPPTSGQLRPRSILLAAAILDLVDLARQKEPALETSEVLEALQITQDEIVDLLDEQDWN